MLFCFLIVKENILKLGQILFLLHLRDPNFRVPELLFLWRHQISKEETKSILLNNLESKLSLVMKVGKKIFIKKTKKNKKEKYGLETSSGPFLIFKESTVKRNACWKSACWFWYILIVLLLHMQYNQLVSRMSFSNRGFNLIFYKHKRGWN